MAELDAHAVPESESESWPCALRVVVRHLRRLGLRHRVEPENLAVTFRLRGDSGANFRCVGFLNDTLDLFQFAVAYADHIPARRRRAVALATTRANFGMKLGFFELDMDSGELRVHSASVFASGDLPEMAVAWCISTAIAIADRYHPAIQAVVWGGKDPDVAIFEAEHPETNIFYDDQEDFLSGDDDADPGGELEPPTGANGEDGAAE